MVGRERDARRMIRFDPSSAFLERFFVGARRFEPLVIFDVGVFAFSALAPLEMTAIGEICFLFHTEFFLVHREVESIRGVRIEGDSDGQDRAFVLAVFVAVVVFASGFDHARLLI